MRRVSEVLKWSAFVAAHDEAVTRRDLRRREARAAVPEWEELSARLAEAKARVRKELDTMLERFVAEASERGTRVHLAGDRDEACRIVHAICEAEGATLCVKSKSLTTEECGLNPFLEARGVTVVDTDLGERIVQLFGEAPSHLTAPAVHRTRREIGELFASHGLVEEGVEDPTLLAEAARRSLRRAFLEAGLGITGANFLVAETGSVVVVENEANSLLGTSLPRTHVVVAGMEKLVPGLADLGAGLALLARSATGQRLTTFTTHYSGPQPRSPSEEVLFPEARELHVVLLDGGRRALSSGDFAEALSCIRCGACLNACPVYRRVGGHAYGQVVPGPIGAVLAPHLGRPGGEELVKMSSLCGACSEVCPAGIDLAGLLREERAALRASGRLAPSVPRGAGFVLRRPGLFRRLCRLGRLLPDFSVPILRRIPAVRAWRAHGLRRLPDPGREGFHDWWRGRERLGPKERSMSPPDLEVAEDPGGVLRRASPAPRSWKPERPLRELFLEALEEAHGECVRVEELPRPLAATRKARALLEERGLEVGEAPLAPSKLDGLPWLAATARWAVARTGSLWVDFSDLETRAQCLLPEGLCLLVPEAALLPDLPEHGSRLEAEGLPACGSLVTGPSKTADIEFTLVYGAHGPRRLLVCFL